MRASFFDIDGTLTDVNKGFLMIDFSKHLSSQGIFSKEICSEMENLKKLYFKGKLSYRESIGRIPQLYSVPLKGISENDVKKEAEIFADIVVKEYLHPYARGLVDLMNKHGITVMISGIPVELAKSLGSRFNFNLSFGAEVEIKNGIYTGVLKRNLVLKEMKEEVLKKVAMENDIDLMESYGFGDADQDLPLLSEVGNPVALNPNKKLLSIARRNNWLVFTSKDDVAKSIKKVLK